MIDTDDLKKIKEKVEEFFQRMTIDAQIDIKTNISEAGDVLQEGDGIVKQESRDDVDININTSEPQILIGEKGQTLNEIQRVLRAVLIKKTGEIFYLNLDINDYKKKKTEYLKSLARDLANEVVLNKEPKILDPMSSYERRIIHTELSARPDIKTESEGEEPYRRVVIKPR
ncbi:KH domain-containing protein [Patescibacteria group bacterium]|nr:KH domain-containing protein [Patescibacteria group bacterium]